MQKGLILVGCLLLCALLALPAHAADNPYHYPGYDAATEGEINLYQQEEPELYRRCHRQPAVLPVPGAGKEHEGAGREEALKRGRDRRHYDGGQEGGRQSDFDGR